MDAESGNLQNEYFNTARKERATVDVFLGNGKRLTGRIKAFDKFTLLLENHQGQQIIFKHAISTVAPSGRPADTGVESQHRDQAPVATGPQSARRSRD